MRRGERLTPSIFTCQVEMRTQVSIGSSTPQNPCLTHYNRPHLIEQHTLAAHLEFANLLVARRRQCQEGLLWLECFVYCFVVGHGVRSSDCEDGQECKSDEKVPKVHVVSEGKRAKFIEAHRARTRQVEWRPRSHALLWLLTTSTQYWKALHTLSLHSC